MSLPELNVNGELPEGVHPAEIADVMERFGQGDVQRKEVAGRLTNIYQLAISSGY